MIFTGRISFLIKYFKYRFVESRTKHGIHSPFVYNLVTNVIQDQSGSEIFKKIESLRNDLSLSAREVNVRDLGTGSSSKRKVSEIAKSAAKPAKYGKLLYRLADHFKPKIILELGTSLGISALYQAAAKESRVITIEGCPETATLAAKNFSAMQISNIEQVVGNFDDRLPGVLNKINRVDYVFFDGNHRKEPTLHYFNLCLNKAHKESVFIFDDIHWSEEMEEAWKVIKSHPQVTVTIDLFFLGLVFFRKEQTKQDFIIKH